MPRVILPLCVLLAVQLLLAAGLLLRRAPLAAAPLDAPLLASGAAVQSADELLIESRSAPDAPAASGAASVPGAKVQVKLRKRDGAWILPDAFDAPADSSRVQSLLDRLASIKRGLPVATSEAALRRFKVADADFERKLVLSAGSQTLATVYLGSSPGLRRTDARAGADRAVYAVELALYDVPSQESAWLDPKLLQAHTDELSELDVATGPGNQVQLQRQKGASGASGGWLDPALTPDKRIDSTHAEALVQDLSELHADAVLGTSVKPEWQQDHPALRLTLKDQKAQPVDWTLSKPSSGDFYVLKSSAHPWYFSVSASLAKTLIDASAHDNLVVSVKPVVATKHAAKGSGSG
jgi:hypothetical protein